MSSKWLTWTPKNTTSEIKPTKPVSTFEEGSAFPHCPRCASYDLYRENGQGDYECLTCGAQNITEKVARRVI